MIKIKPEAQVAVRLRQDGLLGDAVVVTVPGVTSETGDAKTIDVALSRAGAAKLAEDITRVLEQK